MPNPPADDPDSRLAADILADTAWGFALADAPARAGGENDAPLTYSATARLSFRETAERDAREKAAALQLGPLPGPGEEVIAILNGRWHGYDLIPAVLNLAAPATIAELWIATLGFNKLQAAGPMADLLDRGQIARLSVVASLYFKRACQEDYNELDRVLTSRGHRLIANRNHVKAMVFRMTDGREYAMHGSLNLRRCHAYEQMAITTNPAAIRLFRDYVEWAFSQPQEK
jgi:hypothetical protein